jgi:catechol 2,3-dioxygenase-like lactoylglutathione lyase family enzyme
MRNRRLAPPDRIRQITRTQLTGLCRGQQRDQSQPNRVGQRLQYIRQLFGIGLSQRGFDEIAVAIAQAHHNKHIDTSRFVGHRIHQRQYERPSMRLQLALNVTDLEEAIEFYSKLFDAEPYKVKPGYANWAIANPPLKLVLFENPDAEPGSINHLGVETETADEVVENEARVRAAGLSTTGVDDTICCFAEKVETWVNGPTGHRWEWYVKQADHDDQAVNVVLHHRSTAEDQAALPCCEPAASAAGSCCVS